MLRALESGRAWVARESTPGSELFERGGAPEVRRHLAAFLPAQRWFGDKSREISDVKIASFVPLDGGIFLASVEVEFELSAGGARSEYLLPLGIAEATRKIPKAAVLGPVAGNRVLFDATTAGDKAARAVLRLIDENSSFTRGKFTLEGEHTAAYASQPIDARKIALERSTAQQSNTSIRVGEQYMLKLFRRRSEGINPDYEIGRFLTEETAFSRVPAMAGAVNLAEGTAPSTIAMMQELVATKGDGWDFALAAATDYLTKATTPGPRATREAERALDRFSRAARKLGQRTAELHLALGGDEAKKDPDFAPEPVAREDLAALEGRMRASLDRVCAKLGEHGDMPAQALLARRAELEAKIAQVSELPPGAFEKTRCHGDYHLGQVLVDSTGGDFLIIDFEGEPAAPLDERRAKAPPQKDVAGMIRSFDYAAHAAARELGRGETAAAHWSNECAGAFLEGYRAAFPGAENDHFDTLLEAYVLDKTLYEATYELDNRPTWLDIPLRALVS